MHSILTFQKIRHFAAAAVIPCALCCSSTEASRPGVAAGGAQSGAGNQAGAPASDTGGGAGAGAPGAGAPSEGMAGAPAGGAPPMAGGGSSGSAGAENGGAADGGAENGGSANGGAENGGSANGGTESGGAGGASGGADTDPNAVFIVDFDTTAGAFAVEVTPEWAPLGAARFRELVQAGYFNDSAFFRVVPNFVVQFGLAADPALTATWIDRVIVDDPVTQSNLTGTVTFATDGPDTRTTQLFINYVDGNSQLDSQGFSPFGRVIEGMPAVRAISSAHGEEPDQDEIEAQGNTYLKANFPNLDYINTATFR